LLFAYPTKHNLAAGFSTVADNLHPAKPFLSVPLLSFSSLLKRRWSDVMGDTTQQVFYLLCSRRLHLYRFDSAVPPSKTTSQLGQTTRTL
jgi:hypothetical protein